MSVILLALLLASCGGGEEKEQKDVTGFLGGSQGLRLGVIDGAPPPTVFDSGNMRFSVGMTMENVGEAAVGEGTENPFVLARLTGIKPKNLNRTEQQLIKRFEGSLQGAKKNVDGTKLPGEVGTILWEPLIYKYDIVRSQKFDMNAEVCYDYSTHATLKVCVKDDILEQAQDDTLCRLRTKLKPRNSGAPLHVVKADQSPAGDDRIQVNFQIKNVGDGVFFSRADDSGTGACSFARQNPNMYKALVVVEPVDRQNYGLNCRGLEGGKAGFEGVTVPPNAEFGVIKAHSDAPRSLTCFLEKKTDISGRVFQDLMDISIYYRYGEFLQIPLLVQDAASRANMPSQEGDSDSSSSYGGGGDQQTRE